MVPKRRAAFVFSVALSLLLLGGLLFAQLGELTTAISSLCASLTNLLPIVGMLMIVFSAVVYAMGQIMGAETRARGNVWATAALGGALMAFLIVAVAPPILGALFGGDISCNEYTCNGTNYGTCPPWNPACCQCGPVCGFVDDGHRCVPSCDQAGCDC